MGPAPDLRERVSPGALLRGGLFYNAYFLFSSQIAMISVGQTCSNAQVVG
jgi:hypothetical protein